MNSNIQITDPADDDWRLQATARISVDWENPWEVAGGGASQSTIKWQPHIALRQLMTCYGRENITVSRLQWQVWINHNH